jgi:hypothetical protein
VYLKHYEDFLDIVAFRNHLNRWWIDHIGLSLPVDIDTYLLGFIRGELLVGPVSSEDYSSWVQDSSFDTHGFPVRVKAWVREAKRSHGGSLWYRKLMHPLTRCDSESGSLFDVTLRGRGRIRSGSRVVY